MLTTTFIDTYSRFHRLYLAKLLPYLTRYHLSASQWSTLKKIATQKEITISNLAAIQHVEIPSITAIVKKLNSLQYLEVRTGEDKREKYLSLSPLGLTVYRALKKKTQSLQQEIFHTTSPPDLQTTITVLSEASKALQKKE